MKRITALLLATAMAVTSLQGCYGKMALTRKVYRVNGEVKDKFLRSLVSWVFIIVPVYAVSALADFILFNTIEFWSGKNPVAQGDKEFQYAADGETYRIHASKRGESVSYLIDRYREGRHLDTLSICWDMASGNSNATLTAGKAVTRFQALREKTGVRVTEQTSGGSGRMSETVALYR